MGYQEIVERVEALEQATAGLIDYSGRSDDQTKDDEPEAWRIAVNELDRKVTNLVRRIENLEAGTTKRYAGKARQGEEPVVT